MSSLHTVPVVDIGAFVWSPPSPGTPLSPAHSTTAAAWHAAFSTTGFACITNHGVPPGVVDRLYTAATAFFTELSLEQKLVWYTGQGYGPGGYTPQGVESVARSRVPNQASPPDLVENLVFKEAMPDALPPFPPALHRAVADYQACMLALTRTLMRVSAVALGLPLGFFDASYAAPECALRVARYTQPPKGEGAREAGGEGEGAVRYGAHTDYTGFTILRSDDFMRDATSLEVFVGGAWHRVQCPPDGFIINSGDCIERWTNNVWRSTLHRVNNHGLASRQSLVFFTGPHPSTVIDPLPTCVSEANPRRYGPITAGQHLRDKLRASNVEKEDGQVARP